MIHEPSARLPGPNDEVSSQAPKATMEMTPRTNSAKMIRRRRVVPRAPYMSIAASRRTFITAMVSSRASGTANDGEPRRDRCSYYSSRSKRLREEQGEHGRDAGVPGGGASAATTDGSLDLLEQGHLPARVGLQRLRCAG